MTYYSSQQGKYPPSNRLLPSSHDSIRVSYLWVAQIDPGRSEQIGALFQVARFDSSEAALDPDMATSDTDIQGRPAGVDDVEGHGSIWMLLSVDQESRATT